MERHKGVDGLRGLAVALMVVDHVAGLVARQGHVFAAVVDWTVGRLPMPAFFLLMGAWYGRNGWTPGRWAKIAGAGLVVSAAWRSMGLPWVDVLSMIAALVLVVPFRGHTLAVVGLGMVQAVFWPLPGWPGYQPGMLAALFAAGILAGPGRFLEATRGLNGWTVFPWLGRHALAVYVGHVVVMWGLVMVAQ